MTEDMKKKRKKDEKENLSESMEALSLRNSFFNIYFLLFSLTNFFYLKIILILIQISNKINKKKKKLQRRGKSFE